MPNMNSNSTLRQLTVGFLLVNFFLTLNLCANAQETLRAEVVIKSYNGAPESCFGANDAQITINAAGGAGGYLYSIDNGKSFYTTNVFSKLNTGQNYVIVVKDKTGATTNADWKYIGKVYNPVTLQINYIQPVSNCIATSGYINSGAWGGTGAISYSIDNGVTYQSSGMFNNLSSGTYNIIARDINGCLSEVKTATVNGSFTASVYGDTTVKPNEIAYVKIFITDYEGNKNSLFTAKGYDNFGTQYTETNLKAGENKIPAKVANSITYTISSIQRQGSNPACFGYAKGSATITVSEKNVWKGISNNWLDANNWSFKIVPDNNTNVEIPETQNTPELTGEGSAKNITLEANAQLVISGTLNLSGDIFSENDHSIDAENGTIKFSGTTKQNVDGKNFKDNTISNIIAANNLDIVDSLNVTNTVSFASTNKTISTNDYLVLRSTPDQTASVGKIVNGNNIIGKVSVERYMPNVSKRWEFLSIPTKPGQFIHDAWQEGQPANDATSIKGYGIQLTGEMNDWDKKGFDRKSASPSIKVYNEAANNWVGVASTLAPFSHPSAAYMVFIRGDRSANTTNAAPTETILRTKGELKTGDQEVITVPAGKFAAVGNPFASAIDVRKIKRSRKMTYYMWDSKLGTSYGAYQTIVETTDGNFTAIPGGGNYKKSDQNIINSGYAFFVYNKNGGTIQITEDAKVENSLQTEKGNSFGGVPTEIDTEQKELIVNLFSVTNGNATLVDGIIQSFNGQFNNDIDENDAIKSTNTGENLAIKSGGKLLAYETKPLNGIGDTTVLNFTGMGYQNYRFEIDLTNFSENEKVVLVDNFDNTMTLLNPAGKNVISFNVVNNPGSYAANRFMIVFRPMDVLPVTMVDIKAEVKNSEVAVSWKVEEQKNVKNYIIERSFNGNNFSAIGIVNASNVNAYSFIDKNPASGINYYRVVSIDIDGKKGISNIVKANIDGSDQLISVSPNPIAGNNVHLLFDGKQKGIYYVNIKNQMGQLVTSQQFTLDGNQRQLDIQPATPLSQGIYSIEITMPSGDQKVVRFVK